MINPFRIVGELIEFGIQALFVYVLALIFVIGFLVYTIHDIKQEDPIVIYKDRIIEKKLEQVCNRIEGCEVFANAKTLEEYCPTCDWR